MNWNQLKHASLSELIAWAEPQPWCQAMANCPQDAEWHAEGDVWTHTKMVLDQLEKLEEWATLDQQEQSLLIFTALFHDVAKPPTTEVDPETGRVRSPKHAVKGEHLTRAILRGLDCDLATREQICRLVRYHGRPAFLQSRSHPAHEVIRLSWQISNRLLYLFALADTRGRTTRCSNRPEENLYYWKGVAEEFGCYDQPYHFAHDHARFVFFRRPEPNLSYVPHESFSCHVTMLSGLPGSGKDRWLSTNRSELPVVSLDGIRRELGIQPTDEQGRVAQLARERCRELLRAGRSFAFNATNTMKQTRGRWIDLFADYQACIEIVYLEPSFEQLLKQNKDRVNAVPEKAILRLAERNEPPTWLECHQLLLDDVGTDG